MSSTNRENSTNPENKLTPAEIVDLTRLEAMAQQRLGSYMQVGNALAEIRDRHLYRDSHPSFETYLRKRWGLSSANGDPLSQATIPAGARTAPSAELEPRTVLRNKPCETLARACEQALSALGNDDRVDIEIRLAVRRHGDPGTPPDGQRVDRSEISGPMGDALIPTLRWLLTQASGTVGEVAHQLETRAAEIDDGAREQLRDDVLVLDGELAVVKALLLELIDWDSELGRLLKDELPPFDADSNTEDAE